MLLTMNWNGHYPVSWESIILHVSSVEKDQLSKFEARVFQMNILVLKTYKLKHFKLKTV